MQIVALDIRRAEFFREILYNNIVIGKRSIFRALDEFKLCVRKG